MPVYEAENYEKVIKRIQGKIDALHIKPHFFKKVGNGCEHMFEGCCLNTLESSPCQKLSEPFMLEKFWLWEGDDRVADIIEAEMENEVCRGNMELINLGCGMSYRLIITGNCRGEVWNFTDVGVQPCCERQDFLGWFELWLDHQDETDYFKDYVYDADSSAKG